MQDFDFVIPEYERNESNMSNIAELIAMARRLEYRKLCVLHSLESFQKLSLQKSKNGGKESVLKQPGSQPGSFEIIHGILVSPKNMFLASKYSDFLVANSTLDPSTDRQLFENKRIKVIFGLELSPKRDSFHHRNSGLNQVLCGLAAKNNITVAFSLSSLLNSKGMRQAQILGRFMQNMRLCRKFGVKTIVASFASEPYEMRGKYDIDALLGLSGK